MRRSTGAPPPPRPRAPGVPRPRPSYERLAPLQGWGRGRGGGAETYTPPPPHPASPAAGHRPAARQRATQHLATQESSLRCVQQGNIHFIQINFGIQGFIDID